MQLITDNPRVNGAVLVEPEATVTTVVDALPVSSTPDQVSDVLARALRLGRPAIVRGEPGAGKRTAAPAAIVRIGLDEPIGRRRRYSGVRTVTLGRCSGALPLANAGRWTGFYIDQLSSEQAATVGSRLEPAAARAPLILSWDAGLGRGALATSPACSPGWMRPSSNCCRCAGGLRSCSVW